MPDPDAQAAEDNIEPEAPFESNASRESADSIDDDSIRAILERDAEEREQDNVIGVVGALTSNFWDLFRKIDWRRIASRRMVFSAFFFGVLNPISCFVLAFHGGHWLEMEPWQDGRLDTYSRLLMDWPAVIPFYPVYLFSAACMAWWCFQPARAAASFVARFGIYAGVLLSLQSAVLIYELPVGIDDVLAAVLGFAIASIGEIGLIWLFLVPAFAVYDRVDAKGKRRILCFGLLVFLVHVVLMLFMVPGTVIPALLFAIAAPWLSLLFYAYVSWRLFFAESRPWRFSILRLLGITTWVAGFFAAWRASVQIMLVEYSKLPVENPNCFVSSAAAHGHCWLVKADRITVEGRTVFANRQMKILKAGEFAFQAALPQLHRVTRIVYNRLGPPLANVVRQRRCLASISYLAFKPLEWGAGFTLWISGIDLSLIDQIYKSQIVKRDRN